MSNDYVELSVPEEKRRVYSESDRNIIKIPVELFMFAFFFALGFMTCYFVS